MKDDFKYRLQHPGYKCKCSANSSSECGCIDGGWPSMSEVLQVIEQLEREVEDQCRLHGIGMEREARQLAINAEQQRRIGQLEAEVNRLQNEKPFPDRALVYKATQIRRVMEDLVNKLETYGGKFDCILDAKELIEDLR